MPYELVKQDEDEQKGKKQVEQDPRTRRDFDAPPWAKVGSEDWHKAWMSEADAGYLDTFNDLYTKMKITRSRYEEQLQSIPFRKLEMKKDRFRAGIMVLVFALIIPFLMWGLSKVVLEFFTDSTFGRLFYVAVKITSFPVILASIFFMLPPAARDYVNQRHCYNVLMHHEAYGQYRANNNIVCFAEEEHFLRFHLQKMREFDERVKKEKLDTTGAGEDYRSIDEMSGKQSEVLEELREMSEYKEYRASAVNMRRHAGYEWILVGFGILIGTIALVVIVMGVSA